MKKFLVSFTTALLLASGLLGFETTAASAILPVELCSSGPESNATDNALYPVWECPYQPQQPDQQPDKPEEIDDADEPIEAP